MAPLGKSGVVTFEAMDKSMGEANRRIASNMEDDVQAEFSNKMIHDIGSGSQVIAPIVFIVTRS